MTGGSQRDAVLSLYFVTACFCVIAVAFRSVSGYWAIALLLAVIVLTIRLLRNMGLLQELDAAEASRPHSKPAQGEGP